MKKTIITGVIALSLAITSCDSYLDINQSPTSPAVDNLTANMIFPGAEMAFANSYGDYFRITGGYFAQHYSQYFGTSNYMDYSQFKQSAVRSSSTYTNLTTRTLQNMETVRAMSEKKNDWGTYLAATVIRVATYQALVDCYGEIPYSEGLDISNVTPHYDNGQDVYTALVEELDNAISKVNGNESICTNFLLPGEKASEWVKVANALKLRLLMRMSDKVNVQSQLATLIAANNFPAGDVSWVGCWSNSSGQANPYYQEEFATYFGSTQQNVILNLSLLATMNAGDDARLKAFFNPNDTKGEYTGGISGTNFSTTANYKANYWCRPNMTYDAPVYLISRFEVEFFLAEYEARYGSAAAAEQHYIAAIEASFASAGVTGHETVLAAYPWDNANYKKCIGIQKWVALSGTNNFEAWCEMRRLEYPTFGSVTGDQLYNVTTDSYQPSLLVPGTLYTPIQCNSSLGTNKLLQRWPYPESSANRNQNTPEYKGDATPVFWAE
ncbi:MAG: SusD/RagB family nutrient-binding outer membrane lipoprotein [Muribaculaceae bacterium]|nr:SusD/RagB family nutrient-binding outer membrane lipoprotein [Muribaculaceae bacterium]